MLNLGEELIVLSVVLVNVLGLNGLMRFVGNVRFVSEMRWFVCYSIIWVGIV